MRFSIALVTLGTLASAAVGFALAGDWTGLVAGVPMLAVGIVQAWRADRREQRIQGRLDELRAHVPVTLVEKRTADEQRRRRDVSAAIARGNPVPFG